MTKLIEKKMTATLKDVAALAGVSPSTVSRVLGKQEYLRVLESCPYPKPHMSKNSLYSLILIK